MAGWDKKRIYAAEIGGALFILLVSMALLFPDPGITGFVLVETKKQPLDLTVDESQAYILTSDSKSPFFLTSLRLSGTVNGDGRVEAYLVNDDQKVLIYSNVLVKDGGLDGITGMDQITGAAIGSEDDPAGQSDAAEGTPTLYLEFIELIDDPLSIDGEGKRILKGPFTQQCDESCFIEMEMGQGKAYQLQLFTDKGTTLSLTELVYTIRID